MFSGLLPYTFFPPYVISNVSTRSVIIVTETSLLTVGGHRQTHFGQEVLGYHQGVCQGAAACRHGLALQ